jgi:hypothetical protein
MEGLVGRNFPVEAGARRARRPQRAIPGGQTAPESFQALLKPLKGNDKVDTGGKGVLGVAEGQLKGARASPPPCRVLQCVLKKW